MKKAALIILCLGMFVVGLLTSQVFQIEKVNAAKTIEYKAINAARAYADEKNLEEILNSSAKQGWKLHTADGGMVIFER